MTGPSLLMLPFAVLGVSVDLDAVENGLRQAIGSAVEPSHLTVWIRSAS